MGIKMSEVTNHTVQKDLEGEAYSHVFEAFQNLKNPITSDMDVDQIVELIREALEDYQFNGINSAFEAFLIVGSSNFPSAESVDFTGVESSLDCLNQEANSIANQFYLEAVHSEVGEIADRVHAICEKAAELGYEGTMQVSGSSIYGWEAHNYETDCGICIWSDEKVPYAYNPKLLEGELWAIEGTASNLTIGACWTPSND